MYLIQHLVGHANSETARPCATFDGLSQKGDAFGLLKAAQVNVMHAIILQKTVVADTPFQRLHAFNGGDKSASKLVFGER
jgi:hypothetical protein